MLGFVSPALAKYGVQTKTSHCAVSNGLPDSACTPGAVFSTSTDLICDKNYLKNVLNVTPTVQKKVFAEYNLSYKLHDKYKLDHIISLELGGSNNISNLWPEADNLTNSSQMKDKLTAYLHDQVCKGNIDISEAQKEISSNWVTYYKKYLTTPKTSPASDNTAATSSASSTNISNGKIIAANTCTSWTYTDWTPCSFFGNQTREILSSLPTGCSGGNYVLEKECITPFDLATTTAESIVAATTTSSGFDNLLLGVAFLDNGKNVGLSCKPWVNKVFSIASKNSSTLPFMQDNNYSWGTKLKQPSNCSKCRYFQCKTSRYHSI